MANYYVAFDLPPDWNEQDRQPVALQFIRTFPLSFQFVSNGWFINTDWDAEAVRMWMLDLISPSRQGIVIRITDPMFGRGVDYGALPEWLLLKTPEPAP